MDASAMDVLKTTGVYVLIDAIYLGILQRSRMKSFFRKVNCGTSFGLRPLSILTWLVLAFATERFVLSMATSRWDAAKTGALLGAVIYSVYDLTNYGTIKAWTFSFALSDIIWGALLGAIVAAIRYRWA